MTTILLAFNLTQWPQMIPRKCMVFQKFILFFLLLKSDFEDVLKLMKWPQIAQSMKSPTPHNPAETKAKMEHLFKQLLKLHLPYPYLVCNTINYVITDMQFLVATVTIHWYWRNLVFTQFVNDTAIQACASD